jgi:hypothetical protein
VVDFYGEDPAGVGYDLWPRVFGSSSPAQLLAGFPWNRLQLLKMDLHRR